MDINSDILGGKLLLSNNDNNLSNDYKFISSDYTNYDMYYTYIEAIVPTQHLETYLEDGTATPLQIDIGKNSDISFEFYKDKISGYMMNFNNEKKDIDVTFSDCLNYYKGIITSKDYITIGIMILPRLNIDIDHIDENNKETNSILLVINGMQILFKYNGYDRTQVLSIRKFYNDSDNYSELFKVPRIPNKCYVIWNTEYERFMYKNLANMCYSEDQKGIVNSNDIKKDFLSTTDSDIIHSNRLYMNRLYKFFRSWQNLYLSEDFLNDNSKPIKLYLELKASAEEIYECMDFGDYDLNMSLAKFKENLNIFDMLYLHNLSSLGLEEFGIEDSNNQQFYQDYWFNIVGNKENLNYGNGGWQGNNGDNYDYAVYMIALDKSTNKLHEYFGCIENITDDSYENSVTFKDIGEIDVEPGYYFPFVDLSSQVAKIYQDSLNFGESKFHIIPDMYSTDSTQYKQLYRSVENSNWKSLWKYKRTLQFTTFLQDNPVIFPLNLIKDSSSNFFLEIITTRNNNSLLEFALGSGIEFYNKNDNAVFKTLTSGIYHCEYIDDSEYQTNSSGTEQINGIKFIKTDSTTGTFGEKVNSYYDKIAFYYNKNTDNENIYVLNIQDGNTVNQLGKVPVSNLLPLKNIMVHLRPRDINNAIAGTDLGTITINFGYESEYFQDYIDELLKQDELPDIKYHKTNIFKNHNYHALTPYFGYDMDNDVIAGYDKGVWK